MNAVKEMINKHIIATIRRQKILKKPFKLTQTYECILQTA